jgi:hypothetical protein
LSVFKTRISSRISFNKRLICSRFGLASSVSLLSAAT